MRRNFKNILIRIILKLTLIVNVNTFKANELNLNTNYLSLSSNNYVQSYRSFFGVFQLPRFYNRELRSLDSISSWEYEKSNNISTFFSDDNSLHTNITTNKAGLENSNNLKIRMVYKIILCTIYSIIVFICVLGNILVVISVFTYRPLQSVQNMFIVSLALADTFVASFVMPFHILLKITDGQWVFNTIVCHFFLTIDIFLCTASILHLCCIAVDRYRAIKDSVKYAQKRTKRLITKMLLIVWLSSMVISLPVIYWNTKTVRVLSDEDDITNRPKVLISETTTPIIISSQNENKNFILNEDNNIKISNNYNRVKLEPKIHCGIPEDKLYRFYSSAGSFWVPLFIMTFVYFKIFLETKRRLHERAKAAQKLANTMTRNLNHQNEVNEDNVCKVCVNNFTSKICCSFCFLNNKKNSEMEKNSKMVSISYKKSKREKKMDQISINSDEFANNKEINYDAKLNKKKHEKRMSGTNLNEFEEKPMLTNITLNDPKDISTNIIQIKQIAESSFVKTAETVAPTNGKFLSDGKSEFNKSKKIKFNKQTSPVNLIEEETKMLNKIAISETSTWRRDNAANSGVNLLQRQKISLTRERKAARTLGIIMGSFTICWCPFFTVYILQSFDYFLNEDLTEFLTWLGYVNSALNPIIYTIFNTDFRKSFERIIFGCILCKRRN